MKVGFHLIILKLGGSVITKKDAVEPEADYENLERISREIADSNVGDLIIIHGAGSFGHPFAKKYDIGSPIKNENEFNQKKHGFVITQSWVKRLNSIVCEKLQEKGINAVSIQPSSFIMTKNKRIYKANLALIKNYLKLGFVPVIYGDVVLDIDDSIKIAVLSGDQIIKYLAENFKPERVILGSDVDGIYTKNPKKYADAKLIEEVSSLDDLELTEGASVVDVTGGMVGKLQELLILAQMGIESEIINASKLNLIKKALNGEKSIGTLIK
ncbi:MAG: isopentenyl phosphate kinase [Methanomicrobiales archaeon]